MFILKFIEEEIFSPIAKLYKLLGIKEDNDITQNERMDVEKFRRFINRYPMELDVYKYLAPMVSTFIHELVHIKQHEPQQWGKIEYRSYLMNKQKFYQAIRNIHDGISTDLDHLAHASSPQEIPARAHSTVSDYIETLVDKNPLTMTTRDLHDLEYYIEGMDPKNILDRTYRKFKDPNSKEYKIYKRYMKQIAQEMIAYRNYLIKIQNKLNQQTQEFVW